MLDYVQTVYKSVYSVHNTYMYMYIRTWYTCMYIYVCICICIHVYASLVLVNAAMEYKQVSLPLLKVVVLFGLEGHRLKKVSGCLFSHPVPFAIENKRLGNVAVGLF